jgi:hypothetical protein
MINIENLTRKFGEISAVEGLTFQVKEGEAFGRRDIDEVDIKKLLFNRLEM